VHRRALFALGVLVVIAGFCAHVLVFDFITDDAYISFRYAENLALHGALEFNLGERVEGFTNFLWTVMLSGFILLGVPPEISSRVLGAMLGAATLLLTLRLARRSDRTLLQFLPPALLAALSGFAAWSSGGLETALFTVLGLGGVVLVVADRFVIAGVVFALASMARPEGVLLFAVAALAELLRTRRLNLRFYAAFLLPFAAFFAWRFAYYGRPFPNTFYIKAAAGGTSFARGGRYLWTFVLENGLFAVAPLLIFYRGRDRRLALHSLLLLPVYLVYVAAVGGDFMALHRFLVPVAPYLALMIHDALLHRPWLRFAAPAILALSVWNAVRLDYSTLTFVGARHGIDSIAYLDKFARDRIIIGSWMRANLPGDTYVSVGGAGALPYSSRLRTLDAFGLSDAYIAHEIRATGNRPGHQKVAPLSYVIERRPDLVCFPQHPVLRQHGYVRACIEAPGLDRPYCCLKRTDRELGPL